MEKLVSINQLFNFYKEKKIFITGHTGFKGAWLTTVLQTMGARLQGYALAPEQAGGLYDYLGKQDGVNEIINDIRNRDLLSSSIRDFQPNIIFHLAAQPLVRRSYEIPSETFDINVTGTANLLEAVIPLQHKCSVVVITTDKVYQNRETDVLYKEHDALGGFDPYSTSKACCELVCDSFRKSFFNTEKYDIHQKAIATARAGNVIGGGDWSKDRLIPDIVDSLKKEKTLEVRNPRAIRPWQHVLEAIYGYLILGMKLHETPLSFSKAYNFGPQPADHLVVQEVVESAIELLGIGSWKNISDPSQPHEATLLKLDITQALNELQWKPKLNAKDAIAWTLEWYKADESEKFNCTMQQIEKYFTL
jgi:CDP-glucose 4,6-dehydratase